MSNVTYLGGRNGQSPELEKQKAEALKIQNEMNRLKLAKLRGELLPKERM